MFVPSTASIRIEREEPDIEVDKAKSFVAKRNHLIAQRVVTASLLQSPKRAGATAKRRLAKKWEQEKRLENLRPFVSEWNKWREFYLDLDPSWEPKNSSQLTCIENILEIVKENDIDLGLFIACSFKALLWRGISPSLQQVQSKGLETYYGFREEVNCDIDEATYNAGAEY